MKNFISLFKMPYKALKRVLGACLLIGAIAYYTAYQGGPVVKERISDTVEQQFEYAKIRQTSNLGRQIIVAYDSVQKSPTVDNINELYALVDIAQNQDRGVLSIAVGGDDLISEADKRAVAMHIGKLGFIEKPVQSGLQVSFAIFLIAYLAWVLGRGIWLGGIAAYRKVKKPQAEHQPQPK